MTKHQKNNQQYQLPQVLADYGQQPEETTSMDKFALIIVGLLVVGGLAYIGLKKLISGTESSNLDYVENTIRGAVAASAANRFNTSVEEVQKILVGEDRSSSLNQRLRDEFRNCHVSFSPPEKNSVMMTLQIFWVDEQVVRATYKHEWEMLPENVRAALLRTRQPFEYNWLLPVPASY